MWNAAKLTLSITKFSIKTLSTMTFSIMTLSITKFSIKTLSITINENNCDIQHNDTQYCYSECICSVSFMLSVTNKPTMLYVIMLSVAMLSVIMLSVAKLSVIILGAVMLNVAMLSVEVPSCKQSWVTNLSFYKIIHRLLIGSTCPPCFGWVVMSPIVL
jgi:hypothetical protein